LLCKQFVFACKSLASAGLFFVLKVVSDESFCLCKGECRRIRERTPGAEARLVAVRNVRAEALAYLDAKAQGDPKLKHRASSLALPRSKNSASSDTA